MKRRNRPQTRGGGTGTADRYEDEWLSAYVQEKLSLCWSPEQIAGRLQREYPEEREKWISHSSIYRWLKADILTQSAALGFNLRHAGHKEISERSASIGFFQPFPLRKQCSLTLLSAYSPSTPKLQVVSYMVRRNFFKAICSAASHILARDFFFSAVIAILNGTGFKSKFSPQ